MNKVVFNSDKYCKVNTVIKWSDKECLGEWLVRKGSWTVTVKSWMMRGSLPRKSLWTQHFRQRKNKYKVPKMETTLERSRNGKKTSMTTMRGEDRESDRG